MFFPHMFPWQEILKRSGFDPPLCRFPLPLRNSEGPDSTNRKDRQTHPNKAFYVTLHDSVAAPHKPLLWSPSNEESFPPGKATAGCGHWLWRARLVFSHIWRTQTNRGKRTQSTSQKCQKDLVTNDDNIIKYCITKTEVCVLQTKLGYCCLMCLFCEEGIHGYCRHRDLWL